MTEYYNCTPQEFEQISHHKIEIHKEIINQRAEESEKEQYRYEQELKKQKSLNKN